MPPSPPAHQPTLPATPLHDGGRRPFRRTRAVRADTETVVIQVATAIGAVLVLAGIFQLLTRELHDIAPLTAIAVPGALVIRLLVNRVAEPEDLAFLVRVASAGLLLRLGLALVVHFNLPDWFFAPDQVTYQEEGWQTLLYLRDEAGMPWQIQDTLEVGYFYLNAFLFWVFGYAPLAPKILNAVIGTASAVMCYRLAGELAGKGPARITALLVTFFPSLVLWSSLNLRDPIVLLFTVTLFLNVLRLRRRPSGPAFFGVLLNLSLLVLFRDYMVAVVGISVLGAMFISKGRSLLVNVALGAVLIGMAVVAYQQFGFGADLAESASFEALSKQRQYMATGGTAFRPDVDISTPMRGLQYLPIGLAFFLMSPFPWQVGSLLSLITLPEQLVWYALIPFVAMGIRYVLRHRYQAFSPVLIFLALTTTVYGLVEGNAGTAYRHRAQVLVFLLILAAVGITLRQLRQRKGPTSPAKKADVY